MLPQAPGAQMRRGLERTLRAAAALATALVALSLEPAAARPGDVLGQTPEHVDGLTVTSILYQSTGLDGRPIPVSGFVVVPDGPAPEGGRPIVAWAHPTTGVADKCAPSRGSNPLARIPGLAAMLARGWMVAATDYPGLGTPGVHPYLVGTSAGRSVLDSVRAARQVVGRSAGNRFVVWGHSQGGQSALFTGKLAHGYAPELRLVGVAAAAPASELAKLFNDDLATPAGKVLTAYTLWSWSRIYHAPLAPVLGPLQLADVDRIAATCDENLGGVIDPGLDALALKTTFLKVNDITRIVPWRGLIARNTPSPPIGATPIFLAQGTADTIVPYRVTENYLGELCRAGNPVDFDLMPGVSHTQAGFLSAAQAVAWMADRFAGRPVPDSCRSVR